MSVNFFNTLYLMLYSPTQMKITMLLLIWKIIEKIIRAEVCNPSFIYVYTFFLAQRFLPLMKLLSSKYTGEIAFKSSTGCILGRSVIIHLANANRLFSFYFTDHSWLHYLPQKLSRQLNLREWQDFCLFPILTCNLMAFYAVNTYWW